ncbi:hypothetical protein LTR66_015727, partial [Elasticomyces elasticus]
VKKYLNEIQDMSPADPAFMPALDTLMETLHHHIEHEKYEDMPKLEKILPRSESEELARQFQRTKAIVPTRSHPSAPTSYWPETLVGLMAAPIDKFRDYFMREFPDEKDREEAEEKRAGDSD